MRLIGTENKFHLILVIIALFFLNGCGAQAQIAPTPTSPAAPPTPTKNSAASPTQILLLPPIRTPEARAPLPANGIAEFHILHWNDFHGELVERTLEDTWIPGAARLAAFVESETAKYDPNQVLLLDAGDWFEGSMSARASKGGKVLEFYQRLGVDAITIGNHEFFLGTPIFYQMVNGANPIEIVSVNLRRSGAKNTCTDERILSPYKTFELGTAQGAKARAAVIGISIEGLEYESYSPVHGVCFSNPVDEVIKIYDQLIETEHPDILIALSHSGLEQDRKIAEALNAAGKPVDVIIGGHSHSWIDAPEKIGDTMIVTAGERGRAVGILDLTYDRAASKLDVKWRQEIFSSCSPEDPDTLAFLKDTIPDGNPKALCATIKNPAYDYLIDQSPISESVGYWTLGKGEYPDTDEGMVSHQVIISHGNEYPYGLFAHAPSKLQFALDGKYTSFVAEISIKETACGDGAAFSVSLDSQVIYQSKNMLASDAPIPVNLNVTGGKVLKLATISGKDNSCDWTIWGNPYLIKQ
ncbi:MAG: NPCBM/NEW2 domain-containing protein [Anaerolineales bacterium]|nr:NPCBM/NEW2 domain-containing protein [Anaerolineales bacterium]